MTYANRIAIKYEHFVPDTPEMNTATTRLVYLLPKDLLRS